MDLYEYYQQAIAEDELDLYVVGDVHRDEVEKAVSSLFQFTKRTPKAAARSVHTIKEEKEIIDNQDVKQEN